MELAFFFGVIIANAHKLRNSEYIRCTQNIAGLVEKISLVELPVVVEDSHKCREIPACAVAEYSDSCGVNVVLIGMCTQPPDCEFAVLYRAGNFDSGA